MENKCPHCGSIGSTAGRGHWCPTNSIIPTPTEPVFTGGDIDATPTKSCDGCEYHFNNGNHPDICKMCGAIVGDFSKYKSATTPAKMIEVAKLIADFRSIVITKTIEAMGKDKDFSDCNGVVAWEEDKVISAIQSYLAQEIERQDLIPRTDAVKYVEIDRGILHKRCEDIPDGVLDVICKLNPLKLKQQGEDKNG